MEDFDNDFTVDTVEPTLSSENKIKIIKDLLKKYGKSVEFLSKVDPNNELNTEELLEHRISCM